MVFCRVCISLIMLVSIPQNKVNRNQNMSFPDRGSLIILNCTPKSWVVNSQKSRLPALPRFKPNIPEKTTLHPNKPNQPRLYPNAPLCCHKSPVCAKTDHFCPKTLFFKKLLFHPIKPQVSANKHFQPQ